MNTTTTTRLSIPQLLLLALFFRGTVANRHSNQTAQLFPANSIEYRPMMAYRPSDTGGGPFQLCLLCRCCAATDPNDCSSMSCCFGIDCDLPDKPYGVCAFMPKSCNCTTCS